MNSTITNRKTLWHLALVSALSVVAPACGGDAKDDAANNDDDAKTPASCESICAQQNDLCNTMKSCATQCSIISVVLTKTG